MKIVNTEKWGSSILVLVTVVSKVVGFIREVLLLEAVGVTSQLDTFIIIFGMSSLLSGIVGTCVVTSIAPAYADESNQRAATKYYREGFVLGAIVFIVGEVICVSYVMLVHMNSSFFYESVYIASIIPIIIIFSIVAEYQIAIFLAMGKKKPLIYGNITLSLPLVFLMLLFSLDVEQYSALLVLSFVFRFLIFSLLQRKHFDFKQRTDETSSNRKFIVQLSALFSGGMAMLAVSFINVAGLIVAQQMYSGAATVLSYGQKIPYLILTSIWFVWGSYFFSNAIEAKGRGGFAKMFHQTKLNCIIALVLILSILLSRNNVDVIEGFMGGQLPQIFTIAFSSLPLAPIIVFVPVIEMAQRLLVIVSRHNLVPYIGTVIVLVGISLFIVSLIFNDSELIMPSISFAYGLGALISMYYVRRYAER